MSDQSVFTVLVHFAGDEPYTETFSTRQAAEDAAREALQLDDLADAESWDGENGRAYGDPGVDTVEVGESPVQG